MRQITFLIRLIHIFFVMAKYRLDTLLVSLPIFKALRFVIYFNPWYWFGKKDYTPGEAVSNCLEELGPIFVKLGQALSTRTDIFPEAFTQKLARLQDNVSPFPQELSHEIIKKAFNHSPQTLFQCFEETPFASASIAQVHRAVLKNGDDVVVKIVRPKIKSAIKRDLHVMYTIASFIERYYEKSHRFKPKEIIQEFEHSLMNELDLMREAANASQLRRNFENSDKLYVPKIYWDYVTHNILVMERIKGIPVTDIATLKKEGINLKRLAENGIDIFFTQVFDHCFFHADMHPGNIFVDPARKDNPQYLCVDFGIMGTLTDSDKRYLAENLLAFFNRDYRRIALLHIESGWIAEDTRIDVFESAIRTVAEPIFERPLNEISFGKIVLNLFQTGRQFNMIVQPQLILLQKTLLAVEGLGRQLYPELNLWETGKPFLERWVKKELGPCTLMKNLKHAWPYLNEQLPHLPKLMIDALQSQKTLTQTLHQKQKHHHKTNRFLEGVGLTLLTTPLATIALSRLINAGNLAILGGAVSVLGCLILLRSKRTS